MSHYQSNQIMRKIFRLRSFEICPSQYGGKSGPIHRFYFLMVFGLLPIWWGKG